MLGAYRDAGDAFVFLWLACFTNRTVSIMTNGGADARYVRDIIYSAKNWRAKRAMNVGFLNFRRARVAVKYLFLERKKEI